MSYVSGGKVRSVEKQKAAVPVRVPRPCPCLSLLFLDLRAGLEQLCIVHEWMLNTARDCCRIVGGRLDQERSDKDPYDYDSYEC